MLTFPGHPETLIMIDHITSIEVFNNASVCYRVAIVLGDARYEVWEPFIEEMGGVEGIKRKIYAWKCR